MDQLRVLDSPTKPPLEPGKILLNPFREIVARQASGAASFNGTGAFHGGVPGLLEGSGHQSSSRSRDHDVPMDVGRRSEITEITEKTGPEHRPTPRTARA